MTTRRILQLVRVSSQGQSDRDTPELQRDALARLLASRPGQVVDTIEAIAVSGAKPLEETPQGRKLMSLALAKAFDELHCYDIDRVLGARAERTRDRLAVFDLCRDAGAVIVDSAGRVTDPASETDELLTTLRTWAAARERMRIQARTTDGRRTRVARGEFAAGKPPYGLVRPAPQVNTLVLDEERAAVVRRIFAGLDAGEHQRPIARALNADGVAAPGAAAGRKTGGWTGAAISRVATNRAYIGEARVDGATVPVPTIIERAQWDRVQARLAAEATRDGQRPAPSRLTTVTADGRPKPMPHGLIVGRVYCACGARMHVRHKRQYLYYRCMTHHVPLSELRVPRCDHGGGHRIEAIDGAVWSAIEGALSDPAVLSRALLADAQEGERVVERQAEVERCEGLLARLLRTEASVNLAHRRGVMSEPAWLRELDGIAAERRTLESTRDMARSQIVTVEVRRAQLAGAEERLAALRDRIADCSPETRRAIIEAVLPGSRPYGVTVAPDGNITIDALVDSAACAGSEGPTEHGRRAGTGRDWPPLVARLRAVPAPVAGSTPRRRAAAR